MRSDSYRDVHPVTDRRHKQLRHGSAHRRTLVYILQLNDDCSKEKNKHSKTATRIYRVSQEEWTKLRESVPYVKIYRYNPKHLYPKSNGYGDNGHRKVWASGGSTFCTPSVTPYSSTAHARQRDIVMQWPWRMLYSTVALTSQDKSAAACVKYLEA